MSVPNGEFHQKRSMFCQTDRFRWEEEVKNEQKMFLMRMGVEGNSICLTERTRNASYLLEADSGSAQWISLKLRDCINSPSTSLAFNRFRGPNAVFSIQRVTNKRGSFLEITKFLQQGSKQNIILPSGNNMWGWKRFCPTFCKERNKCRCRWVSIEGK